MIHGLHIELIEHLAFAFCFMSGVLLWYTFSLSLSHRSQLQLDKHHDWLWVALFHSRRQHGLLPPPDWMSTQLAVLPPLSWFSNRNITAAPVLNITFVSRYFWNRSRSSWIFRLCVASIKSCLLGSFELRQIMFRNPQTLPCENWVHSTLTLQ